MKKRFISGFLASVMVLGIALSSLSTVFAADRVWAKWNVGDNIEKMFKNADGVVGNIKYDVISYIPDRDGITTPYSVSAYTINTSMSVGNSHYATSQQWRCSLELHNGRGYGEGKRNQGVTLYIDQADRTQKLVFTAPVHGKYNFKPAAIGSSQEIDDSLLVNNGNMNVKVFVKGVAQEFSAGVTTLSLAATESGNLPELTNVELSKGQTIEVHFTAPTEDTTQNKANNISVNFDVELTDEIASKVIVTDVETKTYNVADELKVTNTTAVAAPSSGVLTVGFHKGEGTGISLATGRNVKYISNSSISGTCYAGGETWDWTGDTNQSYTVNNLWITDSAPNVISIRSHQPNTDLTGVIFTADRKGTYTFSTSKVVKSGSAAITLKVEYPDGSIAYETSGNDNDGFEFTTVLDAGQKIYIYGYHQGTDYKHAVINLHDLTVDALYNYNVIKPIYNTTEHDVVADLFNNNTSWTTAMQSNIKFNGTVKGTGVYIDSATEYTSILGMLDPNGKYRKFADASNTNKGWDRSVLYAYTEGGNYGLRWSVYDTDKATGFKFTAVSDSDVTLKSSEITVESGTFSLLAYKAAAGDQSFTLVSTTGIATGDKWEVVVPAEAGETVYFVVLPIAAGKMDVDSVIIEDNVIVTPGRVEEIPLEYEDDPNYEYKYEVENIKISTSSAIAEAGQEVEVELTVDQCFFGYSAFTIKVPYDAEKLSLVSVEAGEVIGEFAIAPKTDDNPLVLTFAKVENIEGVGVIAKITFKIKDEAEGTAEILPVVQTMVCSNIKGTAGGAKVVTDKVTVTPGTITVDPGCVHNIEGVDWTTESEGDCITPGTEVKICTLCGKVADRRTTDYGDHDWNDWSTTVLPDWDSTGEEERTCKLDANHKETNPLSVGAVESVTIKTPPTKTTYQKDKTFVWTGLVVEVAYSNYDHVTTITDFEGVTFDYDFSEAGAKQVKFTIAGEELTIDVEVVEGILGDVNGDGEVDTGDAIVILRYVAGYNPEMNEALANYNGDEEIDTGDAIAILRFVAGYND